MLDQRTGVVSTQHKHRQHVRKAFYSLCDAMEHAAAEGLKMIGWEDTPDAASPTGRTLTVKFMAVR